ncbi:MAG TPA: alkaline phosphatase family protein, partial [Pseudolysinimonas sp.]|nr:alkaline phosphatase family protein [Pseudolysinimonas sp.]
MGKNDDDDRTPTTSRRGFLKAAGFTAAGVGVGGIAGGIAGYNAGIGADQSDPALDPESRPGFEHVVVFMGENRSFDNMLGWLYERGDLPDGETFEGLTTGDYANRAPDGTRIPAHTYTGATDLIMRSPDPDPGEEYPHVNTQLFGTIDPPENGTLEVGQMQPPFNAPKKGAKPTMDGFVRDYISDYHGRRGVDPDPQQLDVIMGGFSPQMLPVLSKLAKEFAVYDHWHAAVPSQTFCNRSFFHASTSHGFVTNQYGGGYAKWLDAGASPTVFNRLEDKNVTWRVYFDALQLVSYTGVLHAPVLEKYWRTERFATMEQFYDDVANGTLPAYAFIEPRLVFNHNDFHPPVGPYRSTEVDGVDIIDSAESDVRAGELLVHEIYSAIKASSSKTGSHALNTLLLITFDEHGGTYDHVPPPDATPPDDSGPGEMGFTFDRLGVRVPAIAVSAYTRKGTIIHEQMDHGSVIATLSRLHGLVPLTKRDEASNTLFNVVNLQTPRHPSTWPETTPQYNPPNPEAVPPHPVHGNNDKPLSPPGRGLLGLLIAKYDPGAKQP